MRGLALTRSRALDPSGYDASGRMTTAYDSAGRKYTYTYTQLDSVYRLTQVKAEKNTGSWVMVAQADYAYYSNESSMTRSCARADLCAVRSPINRRP